MQYDELKAGYRRKHDLAKKNETPVSQNRLAKLTGISVTIASTVTS